MKWQDLGIIYYLLSINIARCISDAPFYVDLPSAINCGGKVFSAISGKADLILFYPDGNKEAISFYMSKPQYSYSARKEANSPAYAIELLALKLGFEQRYPGIKVSLFYLKKKTIRETAWRHMKTDPEKTLFLLITRTQIPCLHS